MNKRQPEWDEKGVGRVICFGHLLNRRPFVVDFAGHGKRDVVDYLVPGRT